jgi:hypothetical protein
MYFKVGHGLFKMPFQGASSTRARNPEVEGNIETYIRHKVSTSANILEVFYFARSWDAWTLGPPWTRQDSTIPQD